MASPWITPQQHRPPVERPWMGMALLVAVPLLALILIRMLWSGSALWFLTVGIILLGAAAVVFLARRSQEQDYSMPIAVSPESNRLPLVLTGLGVLFLAMLLVPNFADGGSSSTPTATDDQSSSAVSDVASSNQAPVQAQPTAVVQEEPAAAQQDPISETSSTDTSSNTSDTAATGETYVVADGDTLWDIAAHYDTSVEAIISANNLENPSDISIGQELIIPAGSADSTSGDETDTGGDEGAAP